jgi:hypothetical protein
LCSPEANSTNPTGSTSATASGHRSRANSRTPTSASAAASPPSGTYVPPNPPGMVKNAIRWSPIHARSPRFDGTIGMKWSVQ